ncbi:peptidylprolyl isomerase [Flavonifractor sp. HCP28S3_F3]|uniref:peptidylprolyl isomerase n=1 Tax=Flavonifractor sp. HCP28S3_F3 TaxID=3438939 RepID=UPI003F8B9D38
MSASREKKQRQGDLAQGLTQKQRQELKEQQAAKRKAVLYGVIGVVIAVLVVILLVWHSGIFQRRATALSVDGQNYNVNDVEYYFRSALINEYYMNYYLTGSAPFDPTGDLHTQYVDEEETQSYYDYFMDQAIENLTKVAALESAAAEEGYTLSDEEKASIDEEMTSAKTSAEESGYPNFESFLKANYGKYMTVSAYRTCLERATLVSSYQSAYSDKQEITDEDLETYYEENADTLDSYDYRYILVDGTAESTTDEEGNTVEPTEEETEAAMQAAKEKADEFAAAVNAAEDKSAAFGELAPDYVSESSKDSYAEDPDRSLYTGTVGSNLNSTFGSWLKEAGRTTGDVNVIEASSGYYVVLFLDRYRNEDPTADIRHILIKAETAEEDDPATEDVDESTVPTQEALDAAKAEAEKLMAEWEAGDKTAESFGELANANSDDPGSNTNGGLYEKVAKGQFTIFDSWLFGESHQPGDVTLIENTNSGQQGWCVVYYQGENVPVWQSTADSSIRSQRVTDWLESLTEGLEAVQGSGIKYVGE